MKILIVFLVLVFGAHAQASAAVCLPDNKIDGFKWDHATETLVLQSKLRRWRLTLQADRYCWGMANARRVRIDGANDKPAKSKCVKVGDTVQFDLQQTAWPSCLIVKIEELF